MAQAQCPGLWKIPVNHVSLISRDNQLTGSFHAYIDEQKRRFYHYREIFLKASADNFVGRIPAYAGNRDFGSYVVHGIHNAHQADICCGKPKARGASTIHLIYGNERLKLKTTPQMITRNALPASSHLSIHQPKISGSIPELRDWGKWSSISVLKKSQPC